MYIYRRIVKGNIHSDVALYQSSFLDATIYALVVIRASEGVDVSRLPKLVWNAYISELEKQGLNESDGFVDLLKFSLQNLTTVVGKLIKNDKDFIEKGVDVNLSIVAIRKDVLYFGGIGENHIFVIKEESKKIIHLDQLLIKNKALVGSALLKDIDFVLLTTPNVILGEKITSTIESFVQALDKSIDKYNTTVGVLGLTEKFNINAILHGNSVTERAADEKKDASGTNTEAQKLAAEQNTSQRESNQELNSKASFEDTIKPRSPGNNMNILERKLKSLINFGKKSAKVEHLKSKPSIYSKRKSFFALIDKIADFLSLVSLKALAVITQVVFLISERFFGKKYWFRRIKARTNYRSDVVSGIKIKGYQKNNKRKAYGYIILILIVLGLGYFSFKRYSFYRENRTKRAVLEQDLEQVQNSLTNIKKKYASDKEGALKQISEDQKILSKYNGNNFATEVEQVRLSNLEEELITLQNKILKKVVYKSHTDKFNLVVDAKLAFSSDTNPTDITIRRNGFKKDFLYVTDSGSRKVYKINTENNKVSIVSDVDNVVVDPLFVDWDDSGVYVYDSVSGVIKSSFDKNDHNLPFKKLEGLSAEAFKVSNPTEFAILGNGYPYLLDATHSQVIRSIRFSGGYSLPAQFFENPKLSTATDLFADFYIYITGNPYGVTRFIKGRSGSMVESPLGIEDFYGDLGQITCGTTGFDFNKDIYLFDQKNKRILRFEKPIDSGKDIRHPGKLLFKKQYVLDVDNDKLGHVRDIAVNESETELYLLDKYGIWRLKL